jgi:hypothetical protein
MRTLSGSPDAHAPPPRIATIGILTAPQKIAQLLHPCGAFPILRVGIVRRQVADIACQIGSLQPLCGRWDACRGVEIRVVPGSTPTWSEACRVLHLMRRHPLSHAMS